MDIAQPFSDDTLNLALDTLKRGKQAIIFANTKNSAEKTAEDIAKKLKDVTREELAQEALHALSSPTKQCRRLYDCLRKGIAFHHSGLASKQRELIEDSFRERKIAIIAATPTLAAGLDLPAYRVILKDLRRFSARGLQYIPVLEYLQMAGRAGRPKFDTQGEAIILASSEGQSDELIARYIHGKPEPIYSKLGAEPALRTYVLSLIATRVVRTRIQIQEFFAKTFFAHQYGDSSVLAAKIDATLAQLEEWEFLKGNASSEFRSAHDLLHGAYDATPLGARVAELYIDPYTAHFFVEKLRQAAERAVVDFAWLQVVSSTLEMRPLLRAGAKDHERMQEALVSYGDDLLEKEPSIYEDEYQGFLDSVKTALFFRDWTDEKNEEQLLESYNVRPGETRVKLANAEWLLYSLEELSRVLQFKQLIAPLRKVKMRVIHGVKEEVLPLLQLRGIGRARGRKLFQNGIRDLKTIKDTDITTLSQLLGNAVAADVKRQLGQEVAPVKENKRKGQISLHDY
ncbi:MAG: helicase-related protein [Nanoarchaeota archaeon]|nr:helicase-related protein [Nanoarchaeota archaeon]